MFITVYGDNPEYDRVVGNEKSLGMVMKIIAVLGKGFAIEKVTWQDEIEFTSCSWSLHITEFVLTVMAPGKAAYIWCLIIIFIYCYC